MIGRGFRDREGPLDVALECLSRAAFKQRQVLERRRGVDTMWGQNRFGIISLIRCNCCGCRPTVSSASSRARPCSASWIACRADSSRSAASVRSWMTAAASRQAIAG